MSLKKKAAQIDLGKLVAGATANSITNPLHAGAAGGGMTAIGMHAESVYRDRKVLEENSSLKTENAGLLEKLAEFQDSDIALKLNPRVIRASHWANRNEASFVTQEYESFKKEIESAGGNIQPIKVRSISGDAVDEKKYEIVFGHRRHRACLELGLDVLALVEELSDADLFAQMDRENRLRADLRPYEQGLMYAKALDEKLFPSMRKMAESLGVDVGGVSKLIALARLPAAVLAAFKSPLDIQFDWGAVIGGAVQKNPDVILNRAREIADRDPRPSPVNVFKELISDKSVEPLNTQENKPILVEGKGGASAKISFNEKRGSFEITVKGVDRKRASDIEKSIKAMLG
jgi:ParB family chromosome partitioning protein